jgi:hypothetical protein
MAMDTFSRLYSARRRENGSKRPGSCNERKYERYNGAASAGPSF